MKSESSSLSQEEIASIVLNPDILNCYEGTYIASFVCLRLNCFIYEQLNMFFENGCIFYVFYHIAE